MTRNRKRTLLALTAAAVTLVATLTTAIVVSVQPRCCLTFANAVLWQRGGYFAGLTTRQVEDAVYTQCYAIGCQWQPELPVGACPSQWGVEQVAASWGMPGYYNPPQWDWDAVREATRAGNAVVFWPVGGTGHAYACTVYEDGRNVEDPGRLWCYDALNQGGRWWDEGTIWTVWSGWGARWCRCVENEGRECAAACAR